MVIRRGRLGLAAGIAAAGAAIAGCQTIAGYHSLTYEPPGPSTCTAVALPASGKGRIRLVNVGTASAATDFCVHATGTADWGAPIFGSSKPSCDTGMTYATATVPFAVPSGTIDVEAIPVGGSCASGATSTAKAIAVGDFTNGAPVVTVVRMGGGSTAEQIAARPEEPPTGVSASQLWRVMNTLSSAQSINAGVVGSPDLPESIQAPVYPQPIPPGAVSSAGASAIGVIDAQGYANTEAFGAELGLVFSGQTSAFAAFSTATGAGQHTVFAIGDPSANTHPIRALVCDEAASSAADASASAPSSLFAPCTQTPLPTLALDTVNVSFYGGNAPYESDRRSAVYAKIAARPADVMCVVEAYADRTAIASAAQSSYPYVYDIQADLDTQPTDPSFEDGGAPPAPSGPPCASIPSSTLDPIFSCLAAKCSTGGMSGALSSSDQCIAQACTLPFAKLYEQGPVQNGCFDCIIDHVTSFQPISAAQTGCTTDSRPPFVFDGQGSAMLLSKHPLTNTTSYILPSTGLRREVLYAQVSLEDAPIDVYCASFDPVYIDADEPYVGVYGQDRTTTLADGGQIVENGWEDEQQLQTARLISFVTQKSTQTGNPAVLLGEWYSGTAAQVSGQTVVFAESPENAAALDSAFVRADPPGYVPACDYCPAPQNPYNAAAQPIDDMATYLFQFPAGSTTDETIWGMEQDVSIVGSAYEPPPSGGMGPAFEYYPREVRVIRPRGSH